MLDDQIGPEVTEEDRYQLSSLPGDTPYLVAQARGATGSRWGIKNQVHWVLGVAGRED